MKDGPFLSSVNNDENVLMRELKTYRRTAQGTVVETATRRYFSDGDYQDTVSSCVLETHPQ
jgi:hypothetical protein